MAKKKKSTKKKSTKKAAKRMGPSQATKPRSIFELAPELCVKAKEVGLTDAQIATFTDPAALKDQIRKIKPLAVAQPLSSADATGSIPNPARLKMVTKKMSFNIEIDARRTERVNHGSLIEMQLQSNIRAKRLTNIQYIQLMRPEVPDSKGKLVTKVMIEYKEAV